MDVGLTPMFNGAQGGLAGGSDLDKKRKSLVQKLAASASTKTAPLFGGLRGGAHSTADLPTAAIPRVTFDPFKAQQRQGLLNLSGPTQTGVPQIPSSQDTTVSDATGQNAPQLASPTMAPVDPTAAYTGGDALVDYGLQQQAQAPRFEFYHDHTQAGDPNAGFYGAAQPDPVARLQQQLIARQLLMGDINGG